MKILIAEDETVSRLMLQSVLTRWGYEVVVAQNGIEAWQQLQTDTTLRLAVLDWMMPGMDGIDVCRKVRQGQHERYIYIILLTARDAKEDLVEALEAGADDYVTKPFNREELRSRLRVGERVLALEQALAQKVRDLEEALAHVKRLQGLLPICMHCKSIRDDANTWHKLEAYIEEHAEVMFSHSLCDACLHQYYPEEVETSES